jgi:hypothetical protein
MCASRVLLLVIALLLAVQVDDALAACPAAPPSQSADDNDEYLPAVKAECREHAPRVGPLARHSSPPGRHTASPDFPPTTSGHTGPQRRSPLDLLMSRQC